MNEGKQSGPEAGGGGQGLEGGQRLEEFVIKRVLGTGGFGITYLAEDTSLGREVVIKENLPVQFAWREPATGTVRPRDTTGGDVEDFQWSLRNFLQEAETLASLDHPGIVRVLRKFEANGTAYFVMPFVEGVTLDALIETRKAKNQPFSEEEVRGFLLYMLASLGYLHERGIYHRDIKPGNVLVTMEGEPILIDFGSARQRLSERSMTVIESAGYTPFEQLQSRGNVGPWSDLYALGGTIYKTITGEIVPKANDRAFEDPMVPLAERDDLLSEFSVAFLAGIDRSLATRIENRWCDSDRWRQYIKGETIPFASPQESVPAKAETARRAYRPMVFGALALVGVLAVVTLIVVSESVVSESASPSIEGGASADALDESSSMQKNRESEAADFLESVAFHESEVPRSEFAVWDEEDYQQYSGVYEGQAGDSLTSLEIKFEKGGGADRVAMASGSYVYDPGLDRGSGGVTRTEKSFRELACKLGENGQLPPPGRPLAFEEQMELELLFVTYKGLRGVIVDGRFLSEEDVAPISAIDADFLESVAFHESEVPRSEFAVWDEEDYQQYSGVYEGQAGDSLTSLEIKFEKGGGADRVAMASGSYVYDPGLDRGSGGVTRTEKSFRELACKLGENGQLPPPGRPLAFEEQMELELLFVTYKGLRGVIVDGRFLSEEDVAPISAIDADPSEWKEMAEAGDPFAQALWGDALYWGGMIGSGIAEDRVEGAKWIEKSADANHPLGLFSRGFKRGGDDKGAADKDYAAAVAQGLIRDAEKGGAAWWTAVGHCFIDGKAVAENKPEAVKWYRKAAETGYTDGINALGLCHEDGTGVAKDERAAVEWYRKAAELGNSRAMNNLGWCYENGTGVAKDERAAVEWYRKAAELGDSDAMTNLGWCYQYGTGVAKDERAAVEWCGKAAELGNLSAMYNLGWCYRNGTGVAKDERAAVEWYRKAAELGDSTAMTDLGLCYEDGTGVAKDERAAVKWYRKAAVLGDSDAMNALGLCYRTGTGVAKDERAAVKWYRKAAELGNSTAMTNLGVCYQYGRGVAKDERAAVEWYRKAAAAGNDRATSRLKEIE